MTCIDCPSDEDIDCREKILAAYPTWYDMTDEERDTIIEGNHEKAFEEQSK